MRIAIGDGASQRREDETRVAGAGRTRGRSSGGEVRQHIQREAGVPLDNREQAPALSQALGPVCPGVRSKGKIPTATETELLADIKIRGGAERVPIEEWNLAVRGGGKPEELSMECAQV